MSWSTGREAMAVVTRPTNLKKTVTVAFVVGTIFFGQLGAHSFTQAFTHSLPVTAGLFLAAAALSLMLPKTAVADEHG